MITIGDQVRVIGQDITGKVIEDYGNKVVIVDDDAETLDLNLEFKKSEVEEEIEPWHGEA
jgi:hypothetical protein